MIIDKFEIRPRYGEVDQMGYVYHANYVSYCHQARTELLRKLGLNDVNLEERNVMLPVIAFEINYKKPAYYDEIISIKTTIKELPKVRFYFEFEKKNQQNNIISEAKSTVVFVNSQSRLPIAVPDFVKNKLIVHFKRNNLIQEQF